MLLFAVPMPDSQKLLGRAAAKRGENSSTGLAMTTFCHLECDVDSASRFEIGKDQTKDKLGD